MVKHDWGGVTNDGESVSTKESYAKGMDKEDDGDGVSRRRRTYLLAVKTRARLSGTPVSVCPGKRVLFRPMTRWPCAMMYQEWHNERLQTVTH